MTNERKCAVCGIQLNPYPGCTMTAHEFKCYKTKPEAVPDEIRAEFNNTLVWEARSNRAKAVWRKRKGVYQ
jgi:hypothetical protein